MTIVFINYNLNEILKIEGPFTLFAPTDDAFAALPAGALDNLIANPEQLKKVLLGHVVSGKVLSTDLTTGEVPLVSGGIAKAMVARCKDCIITKFQSFDLKYLFL